MNRFRTLLVALACMLSLAAQAQWQWIDKDGRKVFSDRAPPPDIAARNILKQPGKAAFAPAAAQDAAAPAAAASAGARQAPGLQLGQEDKELAAKKKLAQDEAAAKVKAEADRVAKAKSENCERARSKQALFNSGVRISVTNASGEREILDDKARAAEQQRIRQVIETDCK